MIEILDPCGHATVQDVGRVGHRHVGIGSNGAMDALALATATGTPVPPAGCTG